METKRDKILGAALRLITQHGYRKVTMSDVADAVGVSRPTIYAAFPNKEAIMSAILEQHADAHVAATAARLAKAATLKARLRLLFDVWIVEPFASVVDSDPGRDLLDNIGTYIPEAVEAFYQRFEQQLLSVLQAEMTGAGGKRPLSAAALARVLAIATRGLKKSSANVGEMRTLVDSLVAMAVATATR